MRGVRPSIFNILSISNSAVTFLHALEQRCHCHPATGTRETASARLQQAPSCCSACGCVCGQWQTRLRAPFSPKMIINIGYTPRKSRGSGACGGSPHSSAAFWSFQEQTKPPSLLLCPSPLCAGLKEGSSTATAVGKVSNHQLGSRQPAADRL